MKTTLKDVQISLRFNGLLLDEMKKAASSDNISLSDFITRLFQDREKELDLEVRLAALEKLVHQTIAA